MRLLYVEDDRINALLFRETCRMAKDVELETAVTGAEALALARDWQPHALVVDLHLPDTDGCALLPALRALPGLAATPAYLCSADDSADVRAAAERAGFDGCWPKPVDLQALLSCLKRPMTAPTTARTWPPAAAGAGVPRDSEADLHDIGGKTA